MNSNLVSGVHTVQDSSVVDVVVRPRPMYRKSDDITLPAPVENDFKLNTILWNCRGLCDKMSLVEVFASDSNSEVVFITEHWLLDSEIKTVKIKNFRLGSSFSRSSAHRGGSAVFIHEKASSSWSYIPSINNLALDNVFEISAVLLDDSKILLVCIYRIPDKNNIDLFLHKLSELFNITMSLECDILIAGDFNLDVKDYLSPYSQDFCNLISSFGLHLMLKDVVTRPSLSDIYEGSCIDNFITNLHPSRWKAMVSPTTASDHHIVASSLYLDSVPNSKQQCGPKRPVQSRRKMSENNVNMFLDNIMSTNWDDIYNVNDVNTKVFMFLTTVLMVVNCCFPFIKSRSKISCKHIGNWYTSELRSLKNKGMNYFYLGKVTGLEIFKVRYKFLMKIYNKKVKEAKLLFNNAYISNTCNKPRAMWNIIKRNISVNELPVNYSDSSSLSAENFNSFFVNSICDTVSNIPVSLSSFNDFMENVPSNNKVFQFSEVSVKNVHEAIMSLS